MTDVNGNLGGGSLVSTENVCGFIFDTKIGGGLTSALDTEAAAAAFANGTVVELNTIGDAKTVGITAELMKGLPYHHIQQFFALAGPNKRLFVSFMDSTSDADFEAIEKMQLAANGIIYQIGLWTGEAIATEKSGEYSVADNTLIQKLQLIEITLCCDCGC